MSFLTKRELFEFFLLLPRRPVEAYDRVIGLRENRRERATAVPHLYPEQSSDKMLDTVGNVLGQDLHYFFNEAALVDIEAQIKQGMKAIPRQGAFTQKHNSSLLLGRTCYTLCRALKPQVVLETGVAFGVTSSFILKALAVNGTGALHSIDLPPTTRDGADRFVGALIPADLRERWHLYRGASKRIFPTLLQRLSTVDLFLHDSLHTYQNMLWEFQTVKPQLAAPGVVVCDDVNFNGAFSDWAEQVHPDYWTTIHEEDKQGLFGVSVFASQPDH